jgi:hypothetical protein
LTLLECENLEEIDTLLDVHGPPKLNQNEEILPNSSYKVSMTLISKPEKEKIKKKIVGQFLLYIQKF